MNRCSSAMRFGSSPAGGVSAEYQETERLSERISGIGIRFFGADQEHEAKLWLLSLAAPGPFPPILG